MRVRYGYHFESDTFIFQGFLHNHEIRHRFDGGTGFRDNDEHHFEAVAFRLRTGSEGIDEALRTMRVHVIAAEVHLRITAARFVGFLIPEFAGISIK